MSYDVNVTSFVLHILVKFAIGELDGVDVQSPKFTELVGAPPRVAVGAAARVALVHVLLAGDALEEGVLYHCNTRREHSVNPWSCSSWVKNLKRLNSRAD